MASMKSSLLMETLLSVSAALFIVFLLLSLLVAIFALRDIFKRPLRSALPITFLALALQAVFTYVPGALEWRVNHGRALLPERYNTLALDTPSSAVFTDLHTDALFWWRRDLLSRGDAGHVDVPRLLEGSVVIQVFALVIAAPRGLNVDSNGPPRSLADDHVFAKILIERWPISTWNSYLSRALVQCDRLHRVAAASEGRLIVAKKGEDLREAAVGSVRGILALEGASALEGKLENVDVLFEAGLRVLGPSHFYDTELGGSQSGLEKGGLTLFGRRVVKRMKELKMIVDTAHSSDTVIEDLAALSGNERPCVMLSHTGIRSVCSSQRNVDDAHMRLM